MNYNKTTWQAGDTITAEKLNNIENGVEQINKALPVVHIVNESLSSFRMYPPYKLIDGVLWQNYGDDVGEILSPNNTFDMILIPTNEQDRDTLELYLDGDTTCVFTSDVFECTPEFGVVHCAFNGTTIPDNLMITISEPVYGEERTLALQSTDAGTLPASITGRIYDMVSVQTEIPAEDLTEVWMEPHRTNSSTGLVLPWRFTSFGDPLLLTFRMPDLDTVTDQGYMKIAVGFR